MEANTVTLIIGLAGIVATLVSSGLGLYFTARARRSPMRELLYQRQFEVTVRLLRTVGRIRLFVSILVSGDGQFREEARSDLALAIKRLSQLTDDAAAVFPTELFGEVRRLSDLATAASIKIDSGADASQTAAQLDAQTAKTALMARALAGVDALSDESMALFAEHRSLERISKVGLHKFRPRRSQSKRGQRAV